LSQPTIGEFKNGRGEFPRIVRVSTPRFRYEQEPTRLEHAFSNARQPLR
jgi:hypothetical protein